MPQAMRSATRLRLLLSLGVWKFSSQQPLGEPVGKFSEGMNISYMGLSENVGYIPNEIAI